MNRREFLKISCSGLITLYLSGAAKNGYRQILLAHLRYKRQTVGTVDCGRKQYAFNNAAQHYQTL